MLQLRSILSCLRVPFQFAKIDASWLGGALAPHNLCFGHLDKILTQLLVDLLVRSVRAATSRLPETASTGATTSVSICTTRHGAFSLTCSAPSLLVTQVAAIADKERSLAGGFDCNAIPDHLSVWPSPIPRAASAA